MMEDPDRAAIWKRISLPLPRKQRNRAFPKPKNLVGTASRRLGVLTSRIRESASFVGGPPLK